MGNSMARRVGTVLAALALVVAGLAGPAQARPTGIEIGSAQAYTMGIVPISAQAKSLSHCTAISHGNRICLWEYSVYSQLGLMHSYRYYDSDGKAGYRLQPEMYNDVSSVYNDTDHTWYLYDRGTCRAGTYLIIHPGQGFDWMFTVGDGWDNRVSSISFTFNGVYC